MTNALNFYGNKYEVYFNGVIPEKDINLIFEEENKNLSKEAIEFIENRWNKEKQKNTDSKLYDGDIFDLISVKKNKGSLNIYYNYTKYSQTLACRMKDYKKFRDEGNYVSNHIATAALIRTTDNKIPIGSTLKIVKNMQNWKFPGGYWDKSAKTIFENIIKECNEEIGNLNLKNPNVIGIAKCNNATCITVLVDIPMTSDELYEFIQKNKENAIDNYEMSEVKFIDIKEERITNLLNENLVRFGTMTAFALYSLLQVVKTNTLP